MGPLIVKCTGEPDVSDKVQGAVETYRNTGFNCAQIVLAEFAPGLGMDKDTAVKVACGLGSGMGRSGHMCGAVTGGILAIGLKYGMVDPDSSDDKDRTYELVSQLVDKITSNHGTVNCNELMGVDIGTPEGQQEAKDNGLSDKVCSKLVEEVARTVEMILKENPDN